MADGGGVTQWWWWVGTFLTTTIAFIIGYFRDSHKDRRHFDHEFQSKTEKRLQDLETKVTVLERTAMTDDKVKAILSEALQHVRSRFTMREQELENVKSQLVRLQIQQAKSESKCKP